MAAMLVHGMTGVPNDKAALRSRVLTARASMPEAERAAAAAAIRKRLDGLSEIQRARAVLAYAAFGAEVDLDPWLRLLIERGVGVFLPWVDGPDLGIARVDDLDGDLAPGWRGVREPRAIGRRPARPDRLEAVVTPGVAFDRTGARLGYGGGHFDRLVLRLKPATPVIGVAFELQILDRIPTEAHDRTVGVVVTEDAVYRGRHT